MGVVYKAEDPEIGRVVAIKTLRSLVSGQQTSVDQAIKRFSMEARSAGSLRHPNIITIFEINRDGNIPYMVMDYIEGQGLDAIIDSHGQLSPATMIHYLSQVAGALDYAHSRGVTHRDIKPSNIFIDQNDSAYILDFGVATISGGPRVTAETILGTPGYMSPEQILNTEVDHRTDLFSLAVVAFECLSAERPFPGDNFTTVINSILNGKPLSLTQLVPGIALTLEAQFERAFSRDRDQRFQTAEEMISAFTKAAGLDQRQSDLVAGTAEETSSSRKRLRTSGWKRVQPADFSDPESAVSSAVAEGSGEKRGRVNTKDFVSPWRQAAPLVDEQGEVRDARRSYQQLIPAERQDSSSRTGEALFGAAPTIRSGDFGRPPDPREGYSVSFVVACVLGSVSVVAALIIFVYLFGGDSPGGVVASDNGPGKEIENIGIDTPFELAEESVLELPEADPVPEGILISDMTDRQVLGVLISGSANDEMVLAAVKEGHLRGVQKLVEALSVPLQSDSYLVRIETVKVLGELGDKRMVPNLLPLLDDHDALVRGHTARALGRLGDHKAIGYLSARRLNESQPEVLFAIEKAIERINGYPCN